MDKTEEVEEKTQRITRLLSKEQLGGVVLSAQHNFSWLTAGGSNGTDITREAGAGALFVRGDGKRFVIANRIEMPRLLGEVLNGTDYDPVELTWEEEKADPSVVTRRALALLGDGANRTIGSDIAIPGSNSHSVRTVESLLATARYSFTDSEIERYRLLGRDAGAAIGETARMLEPGLTEQAIAARAMNALAVRGMRAVVTLVAADERLGNFRHPLPTTKRWEKIVMIVVGARRGGLVVALSRIVCAEQEVPDELRRRTHLTATVGAHLLAATKPGTTGSELYSVAQQAYAECGFPGEEGLHHQGGACGYRSREWVAHPASGEVVQPRQAFAWNPSITGTKVEETCIAFAADEIEIVTATAEWPQIPISVEGREYLLPDVLSL